MTPVDCPSRGCTLLRARHVVLPLHPLVLSLALLAGGAQALGLGEIAQQSALGASLRVVVPIMLAPGENLVGECVRLVGGGGRSDGIPEVLTARVTLERSATGARVVVSSPRTVVDPLLKFTLQVGCDGTVRREYTMLMDPVPIEIPTAPSVAAPAVRTPPPAPAATAPQAASAPTARAATSSTRPRAAPPRAATAGAALAGPASTQAKPARATKPAKSAAAPAMVATAPQPKLTVSTAAPEIVEPAAAGKGAGGQPPANATDARGDPAQRALDAEAAALQLRVLELTAMVDRMQAEVRAAEAAQAAQAARFAAEKAALASPQATVARWWTDGWPVLAAIVALAALIAAFLSLRRRSAHSPAATWPAGAAASPSRGLPARSAQAAGVAQPSAASVTHPGPAAAPAATPALAPKAVARPAAAPLDVSEVSHVTEEAGVYLAFNRQDRAMEVLEEHIRTTPHSLPAAWLMLLDLYHKQGREAEFNELAQRFHAHFNAQQPSWEAYRQQLQNERGLEGFPHVVRHLVAGWNKPECREYLDHLLRENRDGRRTGFSLAAYEDIVFLRQLAEVLVAGPDMRMRPVTVAPIARPVASVSAVPAPSPKPKRAPTLDLELALDEEMLDPRRSQKADKPKIA